MTTDQRVLLQPAFVLHQRQYRETSAIVDLFSRDYGRVSVLAKGVRNKKSPHRGILQAFVPLLVSWQGRGELKTLIHAEQRAPAFSYRQLALFSALYVNELVMRLLPNADPETTLFDAYTQTLADMTEMPEEMVLRRFEKVLLASLGYELNLEADAQTGELLQADSAYVYVPERGLVKTALQEHNTYSGRTLLAIAHDDYSQPDTLRDAKHLFRSCLQHVLGGRPLKTRELFRAYLTQARPAVDA